MIRGSDNRSLFPFTHNTALTASTRRDSLLKHSHQLHSAILYHGMNPEEKEGIGNGAPGTPPGVEQTAQGSEPQTVVLEPGYDPLVSFSPSRPFLQAESESSHSNSEVQTVRSKSASFEHASSHLHSARETFGTSPNRQTASEKNIPSSASLGPTATSDVTPGHHQHDAQTCTLPPTESDTVLPPQKGNTPDTRVADNALERNPGSEFKRSKSDMGNTGAEPEPPGGQSTRGESSSGSGGSEKRSVLRSETTAFVLLLVV